MPDVNTTVTKTTVIVLDTPVFKVESKVAPVTTVRYASQQGPPGPQGVQGPIGPARGNFDYTQGTASTIWNIAHNLGYYPSVTVIDSLGREVEADVHYLDSNNITIYFTAALAGQAFLN